MINNTVFGDTLGLGSLNRSVGSIVSFANADGSITTTSIERTAAGSSDGYGHYGSGASLGYATAGGTGPTYTVALYSGGVSSGHDIGSMSRPRTTDYTESSAAGETLTAAVAVNSCGSTAQRRDDSLGASSGPQHLITHGSGIRSRQTAAPTTAINPATPQSRSAELVVIRANKADLTISR